MKAAYLILISSLLIWAACTSTSPNPFFKEWNTPFGTPPFEEIKISHYVPAVKEGIKAEKDEIQAIIDNPEAPAFSNTLEPLEYSGELLNTVTSVFNNLNSSMTSDEMQAIAKEISPLLSRHGDDIRLNEALFKRIKTVYDNRESENLTSEQIRLLEEKYKGFVRSGANLNDSDKARLREINEKLSLLSLQFGENVLKEVNKFEMLIENEADLAGLPENVISTAAESAEEKGYQGKWLFTIHKPSLIPFLQYSEKRKLREKIFNAYINQGDNNDELDNKKILKEMVSLRAEKAEMLGYESHAHFILEKNMAKHPNDVYELLDQLWAPALKVAKAEAKELQAMIEADGHDFPLEPWDWWHYAEKVKKAKYDLDEAMLRPYFQMENVRNGAFMLAEKLWGITFEKRTDIPIFHEDVEVFEVKEADGSHVGILYTDYYPRASKRGGAWMNNLREQYVKDDKKVTPLICNTGNFTKPVAGKPALISVDETLTLFHEFGHALHGLLTDCTYPGLSGTNVPRDFVELPSQIMENWALEPEFLKMYATHYETGEPIPDELIQKIKDSGHFNQGFATVEYLAASYLDMDYHVLKAGETVGDVHQFETEALDKIGLMSEIVTRYRSTYFRHIFSGGYASGYYSYIWSEVLDSDAFEAFKETSLFDPATARAYRNHILARGNTEDPKALYKKFRGREPKIEPILKKRGLI